jgi:hypothetical protein
MSIATHVASADLTLLGSQLTTQYAPRGIAVVLADDPDGLPVLTLEGPASDWTITIGPDPGTLEASDFLGDPIGYVMSGRVIDPQLDCEAVDRGIAATRLEVHERLVAQWVSVYTNRREYGEAESKVYFDDDSVQYAAQQDRGAMPWEDDKQPFHDFA